MLNGFSLYNFCSLCRLTDCRLQGLVLCRQLHALSDLLSPGLQESYTESCESLIDGQDPVRAAQDIQVALREGLPENLLPEGFLDTLVTCLTQFSHNRVQETVQLARSGVFWVNMGLLQIQVWAPQTIFDPAVKRAYKLNYAQEEVGLALTAQSVILFKTTLKSTHKSVQCLYSLNRTEYCLGTGNSGKCD